MRLIDADAIAPKLEGKFNQDYVRYAPTIDAVPVVRCKDCEYWNKRYEAMGMCMKHNAIVTFTKPDFYCAWGERKQK